MAESPPLAQESPRLISLAFLVVLLAVAAAVGAWISSGGTATPADLIVLVVLTGLSLAIFRRVARHDPEGSLLFQVLVLAWLAKLAAMAFKLFLLNTYVGGSADAVAYHSSGRAIAAALASGVLPDFSEQFWGTPFVELALGVLYFITGPSFVGGWIVWSWLGTLGTLWFYRAFVTAYPAGNRRLYMALVFFTPSILMWTNSVGKDALMAFALGLTAYGAARFVREQLNLGALLMTGLGLAGTLLVRPHLAAIVTVAMTAIVLLRPIRAGMLTPVVRVGGILLFAVIAIVVVRTSASFIHLEDLSVEGVTEFLAVEQEQTEQGGSAFSGGFPTSPQTLGLGIVTVLFRPFPWEAPGLLGTAAALEGVALLGLLVWRLRSVLRAWIRAFRDGYLAFVVIYVSLFVVSFSTISNFGILVRQRVQLLPFLFVLLAYESLSRGDSLGEVDLLS